MTTFDDKKIPDVTVEEVCICIDKVAEKAKAAVRQAANSHPEIELMATAQPFIAKLNQLTAENNNDHP